MQRVLTACPHPAFSAGTCQKVDGSALGHRALRLSFILCSAQRVLAQT